MKYCEHHGLYLSGEGGCPTCKEEGIETATPENIEQLRLALAAAEAQMESLRHSNRTLAIGHKNHEARIAELRRELAKHQESEFHPDWSMLEATRDSLKECQGIIAELALMVEQLRRERDALRTLAGNIYALMIERGEDDCAFVDPDAIQAELREECKTLGVSPWTRPAPTVDGGGDGKGGGE